MPTTLDSFSARYPHPIPPTRCAYIGDEVDILSFFSVFRNYLDLSFLLILLVLFYVYVFSNFLSHSCPNCCEYSLEL